MIEPISVAEIGIKDVEIGQVRFRLAAALRVVLDFNRQRPQRLNNILIIIAESPPWLYQIARYLGNAGLKPHPLAKLFPKGGTARLGEHDNRMKSARYRWQPTHDCR
jgi:hypothetical protein